MVEARTRVLLGALVLACAVPAPVQAGHGGVGNLPRPIIGLGDDGYPDYIALTCGLVTFSDPTAVINQNAHVMTGSIDGGPWVVTELDVTSVTITCTVQTNSPDPDATESATVRRTARANTVPGNIGILTDTVSYTRFDGDEIYVCTHVSWTNTGGSRAWEYDADAEAEGTQCERAVTILL